MEFYISAKNFRCFSYIPPVRIAPITLLIGENSTGKSSFLAALRILMEMYDTKSTNAFNKEPFYLGSFEQIAHYRGGKAGRAKNFELSAHLTPPGVQPDFFGKRNNLSESTHTSLVFKKGRTQPQLESITIAKEGFSTHIDLQRSRPNLTINDGSEEIYSYRSDRAPPSSIFQQSVSYLRYFFGELLPDVDENDFEFEKKKKSATENLQEAINLFDSNLQKSVFCSEPVRIHPRRVYTPSEIANSNSGEQMLLEMANQKLISANKWKEIQKQLNIFGAKSGLFQNVDVKRFGKTDSDPFQLQVKNKGPAANIVDVGYGVSQALPLLYPLQSEDGYESFLLQQPEVHLHPRAQAEFGSLICELSARNPNNFYVAETHSDYIVDRIRSEVLSGRTSPKDVSILLFQNNGLDVDIMELRLDEKGSIQNFPDNYRSFFLTEQARVLGL